MEEEFTEQEEQQEQEETQIEETEESTGEETGLPPSDEKTVPLKALEKERRKRQELESKLRERDEAPVQTGSQKSIYDVYLENPRGVIDYLDSEIFRLSEEDMFSNIRAIEALRNQKLELSDYGQQKRREKQERFQSEVAKNVPTYATKTAELKQFALTELGYTAQEYKTLTDPNVVGDAMAVKNIKLINRQFEAAHAGANVEKKQVRQQPTNVEKSGAVGQKVNTNLKQLKEQAQKTGSTNDWARYIEAGGT